MYRNEIVAAWVLYAKFNLAPLFLPCLLINLLPRAGTKITGLRLGAQYRTPHRTQVMRGGQFGEKQPAAEVYPLRDRIFRQGIYFFAKVCYLDDKTSQMNNMEVVVEHDAVIDIGTNSTHIM